MTSTKGAAVELDGYAAVAVLDATVRYDGTRNTYWPLSSVALVIGVPGSEVVAQLPGTGTASIDRVDVHERRGESEVRTYREVRLGTLAAYTAAAALLGPDSAVRQYFADRLAAEDAGAASSGDVDADADDMDRPLYLSDYLYEATGDVDFAGRYRSPFGKAVKAAYIEAHGQEPPTEAMDVDGREAQVCQYTEADRDLIDEVWERF